MRVLNLSTRVAGNIKTTDSQSGYRTYSRKAIEMMRITNPDMFMCTGSEILTQVKDHDLDVVEIPIAARYDIGGTSSKHQVSRGFGVLNSVVGIIGEKRPLLFFGVAGVMFTTIRLILGANVFSIANMGRGMSKYIYIGV